MPVFRVEKTSDYTVMANHHLRNKEISLKAKGLLSQMLSLPPDWDYTLSGLASINPEGIDAIRETVKELEKAGYITREQLREAKEQFGKSEYVIWEVPCGDLPYTEKPDTATPTSVKPCPVSPTTGPPISKNPTQLNIQVLNTKESTNPHVHVLAPIRPIMPDGTWGAKQINVPILDENGQKIWDPQRKRWKTRATPTTDWGIPGHAGAVAEKMVRPG